MMVLIQGVHCSPWGPICMDGRGAYLRVGGAHLDLLDLLVRGHRASGLGLVGRIFTRIR